MTLMSMRQYAKHRGVSPEAVSKAVKRGRISTISQANGIRKINPEIADKEWAENSDPTKLRAPTQGEPSAQTVEPNRGPSIQQSAAVLKAFQARLAKLDFDERSGKLIDVEIVKTKWTALASIVRTKVLGIPTRAKQRIPELTAEAYAILESIARESLEELADGGS